MGGRLASSRADGEDDEAGAQPPRAVRQPHFSVPSPPQCPTTLSPRPQVPFAGFRPGRDGGRGMMGSFLSFRLFFLDCVPLPRSSAGNDGRNRGEEEQAEKRAVWAVGSIFFFFLSESVENLFQTGPRTNDGPVLVIDLRNTVYGFPTWRHWAIYHIGPRRPGTWTYKTKKKKKIK